MARTCEHCDWPAVAKGLCNTHYARKRQGIPFDKPMRRRFGSKKYGSPVTSLCRHCDQEFTFPVSRKGGYNRQWCFVCYPDGDKTAWHILRNFNISRPEFDVMFQQQGGQCAISSCSSEAKVVDHDHSCCLHIPTCGKCTRGLLCVTHNVHLAWIEDEQWVKESREYLETWGMK